MDELGGTRGEVSFNPHGGHSGNGISQLTAGGALAHRCTAPSFLMDPCFSFSEEGSCYSSMAGGGAEEKMAPVGAAKLAAEAHAHNLGVKMTAAGFAIPIASVAFVIGLVLIARKPRQSGESTKAPNLV